MLALLPAGGQVFAAEDAFTTGEFIADSLKNILHTQTLTERQQLELYSKITTIYSSYAIDSVFVYAPKTIELAQKLRDKKTEMNNVAHLGIAYVFRNKMDSAFLYLDRMEALAIQWKSKLDVATALSHKAFACATHGHYLTAIDYYIKALTVLDGVKDQDSGKYADERNNNFFYVKYVAVLANLAELYRRLNNTGMAVQYLNTAMQYLNKFAEMSADKSGSGYYRWRVTQLYNEYATVFLKQGDWDKAFGYALQSDSINGGIFVSTQCDTKILLAKMYLQQDDYERALQCAQEAMEQAGILKSKNLYVADWTIFSDIYLAQERYHEAETEALKAWQADSTNIDDARAVTLNIALANIYMNNAEKAAYYLQQYAELNSRYSEKSFQTAISDLAIKYETDKKEMQIAALKKQKMLYIMTGIAGVLLAVIVGLVARHRIKREQLSKQLVATNAVFEWEEKERKRFAHDLHDGINGVLSAIKIELDTMENGQGIGNKIDDCIVTIRRIARGMMPASLERYGLKAALEDYCRLFPMVHFHFFGEDKRIEKKIELMFYYCAYELVNNAFKHAKAKNINVQLIQDDHRISLTVQDDGCGFDREAVPAGAGLKNISDRVASLNGVLDMITFPGGGTEMVVEVGMEN